MALHVAIRMCVPVVLWSLMNVLSFGVLLYEDDQGGIQVGRAGEISEVIQDD